ncbi:MAG: ParB/RepB/Spo0J family partition protein [Bacillota bacterium]
MVKRGLGRGLEALIPVSSYAEEGKEEIREIAVDRIRPGAGQSRKNFDAEKINELAQSIREHGLLQPIIVRAVGDEKYEIIAGERRWRACQVAGLEKISVIVRNYGEQEAAAASLIENIQREDLNPIEEAEAYQQLIRRHGFTQEEISRQVGKSRPFIANMLRLLTLPGEIREMIKSGLITAGHARALLALESPEDQKKIAREIVAKNLSVRETEQIVQNNNEKEKAKSKKKALHFNLRLIGDSEKRLKEVYHTDVKIKYLSSGDGKIIIRFTDPDNLEQILALLLR